jgi:predicted nucleic acid-binding protein
VTRALLDINVLIALLDSDHVDHQRVRGWVDAEIVHGWALCAITDAYLLSLATSNGGRFATLDQSIPIDAVRNASADNLTLI